MKSATRIVTLCLLLTLLGIGAALAKDVQPSPEEARALKALGEQLKGWVVWESNRTGAWELYLMNIDGTSLRQLTHLGSQYGDRAFDGYLRPRFAPDGKTILFAYGKRGAPAETWVIPTLGGEPRKLCDGHPLNWTADGKGIYLVRDSGLYLYDVASATDRRVSDATLPSDGREGGLVGYARQDLAYVVLRTQRTNEVVDLQKKETVRTMGGCEPRFSADGRYLYWVQGPKDFRVIDMTTGEEHQLLGQPPTEPFNYTYFPTVTPDGRWLLYGASPGQHDHNTSDYEIYIVALRDWVATGDPVRLSFNDRTDRWPDLHVGGPALPPPPKPAIRLVQSREDGAVKLSVVFGNNSAPQGEEKTLSFPEALETSDDMLRLSFPALIASADPVSDFIKACRESGELTIAVVLQPANLEQTGPARVVTVSSDTTHRDFTLGQNGDKWIFRIRTTTTSENGTPDFEAPAGSVTREVSHVAVTRDRAGVVRLYVDGDLVAEQAVGGDLSGWDPTYRLGIGNELTSDRPWLGSIRWITLISRCASGDEIRRRAQEALAR